MNAVMATTQPGCIWELGAKLGEGPFWHAAEAALYLVDIKGQRLHRCAEDGSAQQSWVMPAETGFALPMADGGLVCGLPGKLLRFSPETGEFAPLLELEADIPGNRLNDGYVDSHGALWFGSMDNGESAPTGALYRLSADGALQKKDDGIIITNGPCHSPDGRTFYHTDTLAKVVYAYDAAPDGSLSNKREFVRTAAPGHPDGSVVDAEGCVWVAMFGGARVDRYSPQGEVIDTVAFPCPNITKVAFGGADLRTVFATTAWKGMTDAARAAHPLAGGVFSFRVETPGQQQHQYKGNL
ncbi:SMP-30/gluconolactonase/LRE family protein [Massilia sp. Root418]|jgi:sugar lactone lactonase YvrE|uniref:SMP-30/gluconolactonase/LRE family protein n=1 Tax=Massilia sp. Root418 TaxID=1736532 RepID=UPI000AC00669|nr:SMP-30/gluconolactonase/LRE family protein [Massilia sp. Root418]